jgi:zinc transport system permease protein
VNPLSFQFMQLALVSALLVGVAAPAVGVFLVQRRLALMGDGLGHVALTGVALGFLLGTARCSPQSSSPPSGGRHRAGPAAGPHERGRGAGADVLRRHRGGVLLISLSERGTNANLLSYLFGSLTAVSPGDAVVIAVLTGGLLLALAAVGRQLFAVCHDEEHARTMGLPVRALNLLLAVMAALTVTVGMRVVGLLLVSALMVVPVATAQQLVRGFSATVAVSLGAGVLAAVGGVLGSYYANTPPGALIVVLALAGFALAALVGAVVRRTRRTAAGDHEQTRQPEEAITP